MDLGTRIRGEVENLLRDSGYELIDVETGRGPGGILVRVILDKPGGVSVGDCVRVSRAVGDRLDAGEAVPGRYVLEVTSPGIDRPLKRAEDYRRFAGERVEIVTSEKIGGRHTYRGVLEGLDALGSSIRVQEENGGETTTIPLDAIRRANLRRDPWPEKRDRERSKDAKRKR